MRILKKLLLLVTVTGIIMNSCMFIGMAESTGTVASTITTDSKYKNLMIALNIFENGAANKGSMDSITRAEYVKYLSVMLGFKNEAPRNTNFYDVTSQNSLSGYIGLFQDMGLVDGLVFEPDEKITYRDALKMIVSALGYKAKAEVNGGFPMGYMIVASDLKLTRGIALSNDAQLNYDAAARLFYNSFDVAVTEISFESEGLKYTAGSDTFLDFMDIARVKDYYVANDINTFDDKGCTAKDSIRVGNTVIKLNDENNKSWIYDMIGYKVEAFYYKNDSDNELRYIDYSDDQHEALTIAAEDISGATLGPNLDITYLRDEDDKSRNAEISINAKLMYNGVIEIPDLMTEINNFIAGKNGFLTLVDINGDNMYDQVRINVYTDYSVVVYSDNTLTCEKYVGGKWVREHFEFDSSTDYDKIFVTMDGVDAQLASLQPDNIVSVYKSRNNKVISLRGSSKVNNISVEEISDDGIIQSGVLYKFDKGYNENVAVDTQITAYFNSFDRIAKIKTQNPVASNIGLLLNVAKEDGLGGKYAFHILTKSGQHIEVHSADKMIVNGKRDGTVIADPSVNGLTPMRNDEGQIVVDGGNVIRYIFKSDALWYSTFKTYTIDPNNWSNAIENSTSVYAPTGIVFDWMTSKEKVRAINRKAVYYKLDEDGNVNEICAADVYDSPGHLYKNSFKTYISNDLMWFNTRNHLFLSLIPFPEYAIPAENMTVFVVQNKFFDDDASYVDAKGLVKFPNWTEFRMNMYMTDVDSGHVDIAFVYSDVNNQNYVLVESVGKGIDANGDEGVAIRGYANGSYRTFIVPKDINLDAQTIPADDSSQPLSYNDILSKFTYIPRKLTSFKSTNYPYTLDTIKPGDIVNVLVNKNTQKVVDFNLIFSGQYLFTFPNEDVFGGQTRAIYTNADRYLIGKVKDVTGNFLEVKDIVKRSDTGISVFSQAFNLNGVKNFFSYSASRKKVKQLTGIDQTYVDKKVYLRVKDAGVVDVIIYED